MKFNLLGSSAVVASVALLAACATAPEEEIVVVEEPMIEEPEFSALELAEIELENNVGNRVYFGYDQYNLTTDAQNVLRSQAAFMNSPENMEFRFRVEGNCDERGTREYNLALGERRAEAAKAYLVSLGVDASRLTTVSNGKESPLDPRSTPEAWAKNRNATTIVSVSLDMM